MSNYIDSFLTKSYMGTWIHSHYDRGKGSFMYRSPYIGEKEYKTAKYLKALIRKKIRLTKGRTTCAECGNNLLGGQCFTAGCSNGL